MGASDATENSSVVTPTRRSSHGAALLPIEALDAFCFEPFGPDELRLHVFGDDGARIVAAETLRARPTGSAR